MPRRVRIFVIFICALAIGASVMLSRTQQVAPRDWLVALACMVGWGLVSQVLAEKIGRAAVGSIASIPYLAAVFLVPRVEVVIAISIAEAVVGVVRRAHSLKIVFNISQLALAAATTALTFVALGGRSPLDTNSSHFALYAAAAIVFFLANTLCVSAVIAVSEKRSLLPVWYANTRGSALNNFLSLPLPYLFAQLFVSRGVMGALLLVLPLIAVRHVFRTAWQLETATQDLLQLMVKAIEARDPYTSGHSQRVQEYATLIGRAVGISPRAAERLGRAALLHDVGKIHEMYAPILRKPDKLTPTEWALMQTHPEKSAELVANVSHLRDIVPAIRHHHENWNGTGYPDRLAGPAIPLFARIIALADTVDAMSTDRPYRRALPIAKVREEIMAMAGGQFDPAVCQAVLQNSNFEKLAAAIVRHSAAANHPREEREGILRAG